MECFVIHTKLYPHEEKESKEGKEGEKTNGENMGTQEQHIGNNNKDNLRKKKQNIKGKEKQIYNYDF